LSRRAPFLPHSPEIKRLKVAKAKGGLEILVTKNSENKLSKTGLLLLMMKKKNKIVAPVSSSLRNLLNKLSRFNVKHKKKLRGLKSKSPEAESEHQHPEKSLLHQTQTMIKMSLMMRGNLTIYMTIRDRDPEVLMIWTNKRLFSKI
jgi:hypothetical protein